MAAHRVYFRLDLFIVQLRLHAAVSVRLRQGRVESFGQLAVQQRLAFLGGKLSGQLSDLFDGNGDRQRRHDISSLSSTAKTFKWVVKNGRLLTSQSLRRIEFTSDVFLG